MNNDITNWILCNSCCYTDTLISNCTQPFLRKLQLKSRFCDSAAAQEEPLVIIMCVGFSMFSPFDIVYVYTYPMHNKSGGGIDIL